MVHAKLFVASVLIGTCLGCGPGSTPVPASTTPPEESIRADLQYIIDSGTVGSELLTIQQNIEVIKETDPEKAAKLEAECKQLEEAPKSKVLSIAKGMQELL
ncbi:hypothetical protein Poly24_41300 [Rosistilla carotiformis]|uniref:Uncharacterized protein n=1 Tax=Rosistilla carotiformis TaxID=2528017 RepID=A0A518JXZ6_9BACT|nr:hypothetical protein [Rosistilla carotiformis]QDV70408.1 hypothetical protein Poly24_41300 [Rosistilla carotiformis]